MKRDDIFWMFGVSVVLSPVGSSPLNVFLFFSLWMLGYSLGVFEVSWMVVDDESRRREVDAFRG